MLGLGAEPDGPTSVEVQRILDDVGRSVDVVGLTIAEFVPRQVMHLQQILQTFLCSASSRRPPAVPVGNARARAFLPRYTL